MIASPVVLFEVGEDTGAVSNVCLVNHRDVHYGIVLLRKWNDRESSSVHIIQGYGRYLGTVILLQL